MTAQIIIKPKGFTVLAQAKSFPKLSELEVFMEPLPIRSGGPWDGRQKPEPLHDGMSLDRIRDICAGEDK